MSTLTRVLLPGGLVLPAAILFCLAGCSGEEQAADTARIVQTTPAAATTAPAASPPPATSVEVVDGDTGKPVRGARVVAQRRPAQAHRSGVARISVPRHRISVKASAPGYRSEQVLLDFRRHLTQKVELWRPALQWPLYGANPARTQVHPALRVRPPFKQVWKRKVNGLMEFPATVWEGVAYVHTLGGSIRAISMKNGRVLWKRREGSLMASSPTIDPGLGALVSTTMRPGYVNVRSLRNGRLMWRYYTGLSEPSPVIRDHVAYLGATNGNVYALDLRKRRARWVYHGGVKITSSPALVGNRLYFGDYAGRVFALDARSGRVIWRGSAGTRVYGTVAVAGGRIFAPSVFSGMSALSAANGRLLWRVPTGAYLYSSPAVYKGRVYFGSFAGSVYCVAARTGHVFWTRPAGGRISGAVEVVDRLVYASALEGRVTAWNWQNGRQVWTFGDGGYVPVSGSGERLLVHGWKTLYAFEEKRR
jgi:outer membrane protein assembly factor BamB